MFDKNKYRTQESTTPVKQDINQNKHTQKKKRENHTYEVYVNVDSLSELQQKHFYIALHDGNQ